MKILVIAAHPDDEVYGMGGTIAKLSSLKHEVHVLIVTDGSTAQYRNDPNIEQIITNKKEEIENCATILGIRKVHFGMLPDMKLDSIAHIEINKVIEDVINDIKPVIVFTHFWGDVNQDHREVFKSTMVATRPVCGQVVKKVYCYNVPSSTEWAPQIPQHVYNPTCFVDIENFIDSKKKAIEAYQTEIRVYPHPRSVEYVNIADKYMGLSCGVNSAEGFIVVRDLELF